MKSIVKSKVECGVDLTNRQRWMPQFLKNRTSINIMREMIMLIGLIGEAPIISKHIPNLVVTFPFWGDTNDITGRGC